MRILTSEQAYFLDKTSIDNFGINSIEYGTNEIIHIKLVKV